ncbi:hypothetical protein N7499_011872 [Penicillium canescens]|uniref:Uncharacterized protein n=1 Tax=Penicillium canescens TaxID=5083 RepID=A0AAD6NDB5_PENCN|nr:hypothetical protein N7460_003030 [Penicillium canescens]KAJ6069985.1 hypothetical protein N7499_011872 [Penicillium canescens]
MDNNMRRILAEDVHNLTTTLGMINTSIQTLDSQTDRIHLELVDKIIQGCEEILRGLQQYRKSTSSSPIERSRDPKRIHEDISQQNTSLLLVLDMLSKGSKEIPDIGAKDPYKSEVWDLGLNRPYNQLNNLSASEVNVTSFDPPSVSYLRTSPSVPVVESGDQFSAETQDMDLHQKIRKILSDFGFIEESLPKHHARLRWKNRHGKRLYDDYIEHEPGSIAAVQEYLNHFTINTKTTMASLKGSQNQPKEGAIPWNCIMIVSTTSEMTGNSFKNYAGLTGNTEDVSGLSGPFGRSAVFIL